MKRPKCTAGESRHPLRAEQRRATTGGGCGKVGNFILKFKHISRCSLEAVRPHVTPALRIY